MTRESQAVGNFHAAPDVLQQGARKGLWTELMKPVVSKLSEDDMLAIAAHTASRTP
jgi:cytochrome c553